METPTILIVGVCAAGKTTLSAGLRRLGYNAHSFAQEHSVSRYTWRRRHPHILIFLHCRYQTIRIRKTISWGEAAYERQQRSLRDALDHADMVVQTDSLTPQQLISSVHDRLQRVGVRAAGCQNGCSRR